MFGHKAQLHVWRKMNAWCHRWWFGLGFQPQNEHVDFTVTKSAVNFSAHQVTLDLNVRLCVWQLKVGLETGHGNKSTTEWHKNKIVKVLLLKWCGGNFQRPYLKMCLQTSINWSNCFVKVMTTEGYSAKYWIMRWTIFLTGLHVLLCSSESIINIESCQPTYNFV